MIVLGIGGRARVGKNLFTVLLQELLSERGLRATSVAFATSLKLELDAALIAKHGISAFTQRTDLKAVIRPDLVAHGKLRREQTDGRYWIDKVSAQLPLLGRTYDALIIEDVRYANETAWVKSLGGNTIYLGRRGLDHTLVPPANAEEGANDGAVEALADACVYWPTLSDTEADREVLRGYVWSGWQRSQLT